MSQPLRVLVADDEQAMVWLWVRILQWKYRAEVVAVFDGRGALAQLDAAEPFDLVITDLQMPGASGVDVLRRAGERDPPTPVILSTGYAAAHVVAEALRLGVRAILPKPFDPDLAEELVGEVLATTGWRGDGGRHQQVPASPLASHLSRNACG